MNTLRRMAGKWVAGALVALLALPAVADHRPLLDEPVLGEDGLYQQSWFHESFLDLGEDLQEAHESGKRVVIMWEQRGCPYCKKTHEVNLRNGDVVDYLKENYLVIQLNLWGDREVTDLDGETLSEKDIANKWGIRYTPTIMFFPETVAETGGKPGNKSTVHDMFGFFFPYHFITTLEYVKDKAYEKEPNFQRYLIAKGKALLDKGLHVDFFSHHLPEGSKKH